MGKPFTLADLRKSACYSLNKHIDEASIPDKPLKASLAPVRGQKTKNWIELVLQTWCDANGLVLKKEFLFHPTRKFRYDWAILTKDDKPVVAVEYEGGIFEKNSGHNTAKHYTKDTEKYSQAALLGWRVLRYTVLNHKNISADLGSIQL